MRVSRLSAVVLALCACDWGLGGDSVLYIAPSSDLSRVAFVAGLSGLGSRPLRVLDTTTLEDRILVPHSTAARWAPDDQWIVYNTGVSLRAIRPDGSGDFELVWGAFEGSFDWVEDGASLLAVLRSGDAVRISFPAGTVQSLTQLGAANSIAVFGAP